MLIIVPPFEQMYSNMLDKSNKVGRYFSKNMEFLRSSENLSMAEMAEIIGKGKSIVGNYEKGTAEASASTALKIVQHFGITLPQLMEEDLSKKGNLKGNPKGNPSKIDAPKTVQSTQVQMVVDTSGLKLVPIADIRAAAGDGYLNPTTFDQTDVIRLPAHMVRGGEYLCIRIKGTSMAPTLQDGGYVIIRMVDPGDWALILNDRIYVVVDNDGKTYLKRIKNRFSGERGFIVLTSDNPDKVSNPTFNLNASEIRFIWYVEWYFTAKMPNIHDQYYSKLSNLEDTVQELQHQFLEFKKVTK